MASRIFFIILTLISFSLNAQDYIHEAPIEPPYIDEQELADQKIREEEANEERRRLEEERMYEQDNATFPAEPY